MQRSDLNAGTHTHTPKGHRGKKRISLCCPDEPHTPRPGLGFPCAGALRAGQCGAVLGASRPAAGPRRPAVTRRAQAEPRTCQLPHTASGDTCPAALGSSPV